METLPDDEERRRPAGEGSREFALFVLDPEGRIQSENLGAERATGLGAAEVVGRPLAVLYADEAVAAGEPARNLETALQWGYFEGESWRVGRDGGGPRATRSAPRPGPAPHGPPATPSRGRTRPAR